MLGTVDTLAAVVHILFAVVHILAAVVDILAAVVRILAAVVDILSAVVHILPAQIHAKDFDRFGYPLGYHLHPALSGQAPGLVDSLEEPTSPRCCYWTLAYDQHLQPTKPTLPDHPCFLSIGFHLSALLDVSGGAETLVWLWYRPG